MTTMDSDSESQDSDDGRRFRFEATRKDTTPVSRTRERVSPQSDLSEQRSRSPRSDRDRRDNERFSRRNRDSRSRHNSRQSSRDRDLRVRRDRYSSQNYVKDSKDGHDSRHAKYGNSKELKMSSIQKEGNDREAGDSKDFRDSKDRRDLKSSRSHEKGSKYSREARSSRDRNRKKSRDRSCSDRSSSDKYRIRSHKKRKSLSRDDHNRVKEDRVPDKSENVKSSLALGQTENNLNKKVAGSTGEECTDFNISDFEIVSDLEEISSDASNLSQSHRSKVRKRQSKQQNLQFFDKDSERESEQVDELCKVNPRIDNHSSASTNSNPSALSDFSLGSATANKTFNDDEEVVTRMEVDVETLPDSSLTLDVNRLNQRENSSTYGPILPPNLVKRSSPTPADDTGEASELSVNVQSKDVEREVKRERLIGPFLPPSSVKSNDFEIEDDLSSCAKEVVKQEESNGGLHGEETQEDDSEPRVIGPVLPAHLIPKRMETDDNTFGPVLPPHLMKKEGTDSESRDFGPDELRPDDNASSESDNDDVIGPLPADHPAAKTSIVQQSLEFRARRIQNEFLTEPVTKENKREEWMTELPPVQAAALGLGPRKFKMRAGPDFSDRSSWTDTPADKVRKEQERAEERLAAKASEKEEGIKEFPFAREDSAEKPKKRQKSLLEMHQKKMKKKKKKEEKEARDKGKPTRRPFDRDIDLESNRFDEAQKRHIFMKSQLLDDRFTRGKM